MAAHDHGPAALSAGARHRRPLTIAFALIVGFLVVQVVAGLVTGSLALLSDAGHMATDAVGLGMALAVPVYAPSFLDDRFEFVVERRYGRGERFERRYERWDRFERRYDRRSRAGAAPACTVPFRIDSRGPGWSVGGEYVGRTRLTPEGLEIELGRGNLEADRPARVRGIVFGLAEWTGESSWTVTHRAEPIPLGMVEPGRALGVGGRRLVVPGVGAAELAEGWLVVEHVLDDPRSEGGTAWTYGHARPGALAPLRFGCPRS